MSDDDFMQNSDEEYDFDYEEEDDDGQNVDADVENKYYHAKQLKTSDPDDALADFLAIPELEVEQKGAKGEWGFKGLKQAIKLEFSQNKYDEVIKHFEQLLTYVKSSVTKNYSEKSILNMLNLVEKGSSDAAAGKCIESVYSLTLDCFKTLNNERLWLKTNMKLTRLYMMREEYQLVAKKVRELHKACQRPDGTNDPSKGTYSVEIYALEIQMCAATKKNHQLKKLYKQALEVKTALPHPRIQGIIRECGGKMHMNEENWKEAQSDFFEAFRNYDEAGDARRVQVLKYLLLTTILMGSDINPFDSQETKPFKNDPRIASMTELVDAYQHHDINRYEKVLQKNTDMLEDPFIAENIDEVTRNMRSKAVVKLIAPYSRVQMSWISRKLRTSEPEVQEIVSLLICEERIHGRINQAEGTLDLQSPGTEQHVETFKNMAKAVDELRKKVFSETEGLKKQPELQQSNTQIKRTRRTGGLADSILVQSLSFGSPLGSSDRAGSGKAPMRGTARRGKPGLRGYFPS